MKSVPYNTVHFCSTDHKRWAIRKSRTGKMLSGLTFTRVNGQVGWQCRCFMAISPLDQFLCSSVTCSLLSLVQKRNRLVLISDNIKLQKIRVMMYLSSSYFTNWHAIDNEDDKDIVIQLSPYINMCIIYCITGSYFSIVHIRAVRYGDGTINSSTYYIPGSLDLTCNYVVYILSSSFGSHHISLHILCDVINDIQWFQLSTKIETIIAFISTIK